MQSYNQPKLHPVNQEEPDYPVSKKEPEYPVSKVEPDSPVSKMVEPDSPVSKEEPDGPVSKESLTLKRMEMLLNISTKMATFETLDGMLGALVDIIVLALDADRATVFLHDKQANELYSLVARGNFHQEIRMSVDKGVAGHVFMKKKGAIVNDAYSDKRFDRSVDDKTGYKTESILCDPIKTVKGEIIGVAQVLNKRNGRFTQEDLDLLDAVTTQAAVALKTTQIVEHMKSREREMKVLNKVIADITSEIDLGKILTESDGP